MPEEVLVGNVADVETVGIAYAPAHHVAKSLEEGANPKLDTISKVLGVFGCKLSITPNDSHRHA